MFPISFSIKADFVLINIALEVFPYKRPDSYTITRQMTAVGERCLVFLLSLVFSSERGTLTFTVTDGPPRGTQAERGWLRVCCSKANACTAVTACFK